MSGARQHLTALVDDGLAEATELPRPAGQRGRPQLAYTVTDKADGLFPKAYGELTNELLGYVADADAGLVDTLFERRRDERIRNATERLAPNAARLKAKVAELTRILDDDGYLATCEEIGPAGSASSSTTARSGRSPSATGRRARARSTSSAPCCRARAVERVQHMVAGAPHCAYEVRPSR